MKADTTRSTFKQTKHYSGVLMQQGRVQLDADWNEQIDITGHRIETETIDVIGNCGAPMHDAGFHIVANANDLTAEEKKLPENQNPPAIGANDLLISGGRYYVDGILSENDSIVGYTKQPDLPNLTVVNQAGTYLAYLDVWSRHMSALEDPSIREVALGGPDTATRSKTIWQVKLFRVGDANLNANCATVFQAWNDEIAAGTGTLAAKAATSAPSNDPCIVAPGAGYRRLENQHYRVEVHDKGALGAATFKFSRDNGSIVTKWESQAVNDLTVSNAGRDDVLRFAAGNWVELSDDTNDLLSTPGTLVQLAKVEGNVLTINPASAIPAGPINIANFPRNRNPKVRRWDMAALVKPNNQNWLDLEAGVQVHFTNGTYKTGDYWLIPARTDTADVEWPIDPMTNQPATQLPFGIKHHYCRLAVGTNDGTNWTKITDCRHIFPPLAELIDFFYVGGDGQEAMPDLTQPNVLTLLPLPLEAGVTNGEWPVAGAQVRFTVTKGTGKLTGNVNTLTVPTGANGVASCTWSLDATNQAQQVEAVLLDEGGNPICVPIHYLANLSVASQVAYNPANCPNLAGALTVQDAIDILCKVDHGGKCCCVTVGKGGDFESLEEAIKELAKQKVRDICICLLPGDHEAKDISLANDGKGDLHLHIAGCGRGTRLRLKQPAVFDRLTSFTMRELEIFSDAEKLKEDLAAFSFDSCEDVTITACRIAGVPAPGALLAIHDADHVRLADNFLEAATPKSLDITNEIFHLNNSTLFLTTLFSMTKWPEFNPAADDFGAELAKLSTAERQTMRGDLQKAVNDNQGKLQFGNVFTFFKFMAALAQDKTTATTYADLLRDIRTAAVKANSGVAVVLGDAASSSTEADPFLGSIALDDDDFFLLEGNEITGAISLMGQPLGAGITNDDLKKLDGLLKAAGPVRIVGLSGTLELRSNQLTHVLVAQVVIDQLQKVLKDGKGTITGVFGRCLLTDNVIEYGTTLVGEQLSLMANKFTCRGQNVAFVGNIGTSIADSTVFVGNTLRLTWRNASRVSAFEANTTGS
jgi:hypothetical protein